MHQEKPTIKGIFVKSHLRAVEEKKGQKGLQELERLFGKPINFKNLDDVPVSDEVRLIELAFDLIGDPAIPSDQRAFEAGRLHFRDFATTPLARIIFSVFRNNFKTVFKHSSRVAEHIFQGVTFSTEDIGDNALCVRMENNDYPVDHFRGFFQEWLETSGNHGTVSAKKLSPNTYVYVIEWDA